MLTPSEKLKNEVLVTYHIKALSVVNWIIKRIFSKVFSVSKQVDYCSDFRYESNGIFVLGVGFFFLQTNFDFLTSHF